ncbi:MAG: S9 family peptidase [Pseudomonadota bacterium]
MNVDVSRPHAARLLVALLAAALLVSCSKPENSSSAASKPTAAAPASLNDVALIPRRLLFGNPARTQGRISPDGRWLSWLAPVDGVMNIFVAPAANPDAARAVTAVTGRGLAVHYWAYDNDTLLYLRDQGGNENTHLYGVSVSEGTTRKLTDVGDEVRVQLSALSPEQPNIVVVSMNDRDPSLSDLHRIDLSTGELTLLLENPGYQGFDLDQRLEPRVASRPLEDGGVELLYREPPADDDANPPWAPFATIPKADALVTATLRITPDGEGVILRDSRERDRTALTRVNFADGSVEVLAEHPRADIDNYFFDPRSGELLAWSASYLNREWVAYSERFEATLDTLQDALDGEMFLVSSTNDLSRVLAYVDRADAPGEYFVYSSADASVDRLLATRPDLKDIALLPMEALEIEARDGLKLVSYLTRAAGQGDGPAPMVLLVHGGPWARDEAGFRSLHQMLANRGYAVLSVNYRGSTGFGKAFVNAAVGEFAGKMHDDLIDAVTWAIAEGVADPDRVAIMGGSYGGYATLVGVTFTPDTFACGVDIVGPSSLVTLIESFPDYWKPFLQSTWYTFVGDPTVEEERAEMLSRSPISRVADIKVPLLIGQGENDPRVTKLESDQLVAAMQERDLPVTYLNYPDEGHGFARPENSLSFFATTEHFLAQCLGGRAEPIGDAFDGSSVEVLAGADYIPALNGAADD